MRKILLKVLLLAVLFMSCIWIINNIFIPKRFDGITPMKSYYGQPEETIDVLFLGSSHCGVNTDMGDLWKSYGVPGYALWGSAQPSWNSYFYLKEALKTQSPKVVMFEVYMLTYQFEYQDEARQLVNTGGMRFSHNKWEAIKVSAPKERWLDLMLGYPLYHSRYNELTEEDFKFFPNNKELETDKGTTCRWGTGVFELPDVSGITECAPLYEKGEEYLRKIIELCQEKGIAIILYTAPDIYRYTEQPYYNSVEAVAQEYGIEYLNFNLLDDAIGFTAEDIWTDGGHLNTAGARKITRAIGEYLSSHYDLEDHRGQERYASWDKNADMLEKEYLRLIQDKEDYLAEVAATDYTCLLVQNSANGLVEQNDNIVIIRDINGVPDITPVDCKPEGSVVDLGEEFSVYLSDGLAVYREGNELINETGNGAVAVVYDERNNEVVDVVAVLENNNFLFEHKELR